jgi:hypothetical protein
MTKDNIIAKTFYQQFYSNFKINKDILQLYIFKGFLLNENLNKIDKIRYLLYSFNYELKYYLDKISDSDNDLLIEGKTFKILQIMRNLNNFLLFSNHDNTYTVMFYFILDRKNIYNKYKKYFKLYLDNIIERLKCSNNDILDATFDYDYQYNKFYSSDKYFFKLRLNIIYKKNEILKKIMTIDSKSTKRTILFNNNNVIKNTISLIKTHIIDNVLKILY